MFNLSQLRMVKMLKSWIYGHEIEDLRIMWRSDLSVNRNKLELASLEQASLFDKWYQALEDAEDDLAEAKIKEGRVRSKVELMVRSKYPSDKEGAIRAKVSIHKQLTKAEKKVLKINRYVRTLKGAVAAFNMRKSMIQTLKDLYISNYWNKTTKGGVPLHERKQSKRKNR
jgi:hypothetical protein